jgi:ubiquinone/menaquinone biosynthesis C-methylase UbiE
MSSGFAPILAWHQRAYSKMEAVDYYKLVYQSVFGVGHLIGADSHVDPAAGRQRIRTALETEVGASSHLERSATRLLHENLIDPLDEELALVRLNLRPFARLSRNLPRLVPALIRTAASVAGDRDLLRQRLDELLRWLRRNVGASSHQPDLTAAAAALVRAAGSKGFPALHHSAAFRRHYHPAYRVVLRELVSKTLVGSRSVRAFENRLRYDQRIAEFRAHGCDIPAERFAVILRARPLGNRVLEIGTGYGALTAQLAHECFRKRGHDSASCPLFSVDKDAEAQGQARLNLRFEAPQARVRFVLADAADLPFPDRNFDTVISANSFHHFTQPESVLREMARVCRGKLVVADFNRNGFRVVQTIHRAEGRKHPESGRSFARVPQLLTALGFRVGHEETAFETIYRGELAHPRALRWASPPRGLPV